MNYCFGFFIDSNEVKLLNQIKTKPLFGKITLNFAEGIIRSVSVEESTINAQWSQQVKQRNDLRVD